MEIQIHRYTPNFPGMSSNNRIKAFNFKCPQIFSKLHDTGDTSGGERGGFFLTKKKKHLDDFSPFLDPSKQRTKQSTQVPFLHPHRGHIPPMRRTHPPYFEVPNWEGQYVTLPENNICHPKVVGKMCILFPFGICDRSLDGKIHSSEVSEFLSRKSGLSTEPSPWFCSFPKMNQGTFLMSTPRTVRSWRNLANRWKTKTYHICRVLKTDWRKSRLGDPKHEQIPTQKSPFLVDHLQGIISPHVGDGAHHRWWTSSISWPWLFRRRPYLLEGDHIFSFFLGSTSALTVNRVC